MTDTDATPHDTHKNLHSDQPGRRGEHCGRDRNPVVKVIDVAWLEFEKPDLMQSAAFARTFGFQTCLHTPDEIQLRGTYGGPPCVVVHRGHRARLAAVAFQAADEVDVLRLADRIGVPARPLPESIGGLSVDTVDPSGLRVRVVAGVAELPALPEQQPLLLNTGRQMHRTNTPQRPRRAPPRIQRLGHVVLQTTKYLETLNWYLHHLGVIVSDFLFFPGQRDRGPTMSFIRCDRGSIPVDHHTLALALGPTNRYIHSAYQVSDFDAVAVGGECLRELGYQRSWGIGRHIQGSQIFDYWRDPDGLLMEHFTDGDVFDNTLQPGWAPFTASGLAQWGPRATNDFLGISPRSAPQEALSMLTALRKDNEFDLNRLIGLLKVASL